ncbi:hypothetical protein [Candidatus Lokiarchaeum ossiferum]|uniref:hypothetical protein n=1 Tax=Candidatus Lokiarchaeum ossiferum TaxID=2951803 RepID=UPI00352FC43A
MLSGIKSKTQIPSKPKMKKSTSQQKEEERLRKQLKHKHDILKETSIRNLTKPMDQDLFHTIDRDDFFAVHNLSFKCNHKKAPEKFPCKESWTGKYMRKIIYLDNATLIITPHTIQFHLNNEFCAYSEKQAIDAAQAYVIQVLFPYLERLGFEFFNMGNGSHVVQFGKHHTVLPPNIVPEEIRKLGTVRTVQEGSRIFVIDDSKGTGGEMEFFGKALQNIFKDYQQIKKNKGYYV